MNSALNVSIVTYGAHLHRLRSVFRRFIRDAVGSISRRFGQVTPVFCLALVCRGSSEQMHLYFLLTRLLCCEGYLATHAIPGYRYPKDPS
jgi:hypothetical protein